MSFYEFFAVSKNFVSLTCIKGFDFDTAKVDFSSLIFPYLRDAMVVSENESDFQFIVNVLENSIPQDRGFLKSLVLSHSPSLHPNTRYPVDYAQLSTSLIKVIEVWIFL
jgi:hypothetical protein